jgi:transcriptional regulator of acetoin/glycerol metabolism
MRIGDLGVLASRFVEDGGRPIEIEIEAGRALLRHAWPGNVRELGHRLKAAATLAAGQPMRLAHLLPEIA